MKYKILYHMMKKVKASLEGGTAEEVARREITERGMKNLQTHDIRRLINTLLLPKGDPLLVALQGRLSVLTRAEVEHEITEKGGVETLETHDIRRLINTLTPYGTPYESTDDPLLVALKGRLATLTQEREGRELVSTTDKK
jgi:hypothetical protein